MERLEVVEKIECFILENKLIAHKRLPSERYFSELFCCHRNTVRSALQYLESIGVVYTRKNSGAFVAPPKLVRNLQDFESLWYFAKNNHYEMESFVVNFEMVAPSPQVKRSLKICGDTPVYRLCRVRTINNVPAILENTFLSTARFKNLHLHDMHKNGLFEILATEYNVCAAEGWQNVDIVYADELEEQTLQIPLGSPLLSLRGITFDDYNVPIEVFQNSLRADMIGFYHKHTF